MSGLRGRTRLWLILSALPVLVLVALLLLAGEDTLTDSRTLLLLVGLIGLALLVGGWFAIWMPIFTRLDRATKAAKTLADGTTPEPLEDRVPDELGDISRAVDGIARGRDNDRRATIDLGERFRHLTSHDPLTGIVNRQSLMAQIGAQLRSDDDRAVSVLFIDLDDFRLVNELFGHAVGDEVLVAASNRLRRLVGDEVTVGRWGADEFIIIVTGVEPAVLTQLATRVRALFDEPINTAAGPHPIACSVGIATADAGTASVDELVQQADLAVEEEKQAHRRIRSISPETARLVELALRENRLEVWYQPVVRLVSPTETQMVGAEAFVRLRADDNTLRVPSDFLGEIMTSRYAREIDERMASMLLADMSVWQTRGLVGPDFFVSLNLSPASLHDAELGRTLSQQCASAGVAPQTIVLDVSEEAGELDQITASDLRLSGFRLSIDDLGLKRSNFDRLFSVGAEFAKLHRRWLDDEIMLEALVNICQRKGLSVVAEGVETMEQLALLFDRGVRLCQGYVISRPIAAEDFGRLLGAGRPSPADA